ncbi:hypothetical protein CDG77_00380 [Nostoc sp. 'Peltigera membranacea cyanobiont' 213]|uniref:hypothetical protein n=1 Tax=Nostoc sp. 'Peltigera membranacea cyanobiont' 213 TaxID=2014530 RepID=UPI000B9557E5|nr:hypothetical protein [Nostoc sp. 'Peltigera membranacea cyanobiont' 213]OYD99635.1 hypothetical protein CDG77_00380 [Nostoc sp. 'Peltigera membranacea cyanobiont' 213]
MKSSFISLVVVIGVLVLPQSVYANQDNVPIATGDALKQQFPARNQAGALLTEPATITTTWSNFTGQTNNPKQTAESISLVQERGCQKINPLEFINNPGAFFKECQKPTNIPSSQSTEPIEYFKVPKLDSGISVTVTKF